MVCRTQRSRGCRNQSILSPAAMAVNKEKSAEAGLGTAAVVWTDGASSPQGYPAPKKCPLTVCLFVWLCHMACGILVPRPGIEPTPLALHACSLNHWTAREVLPTDCLILEVERAVRLYIYVLYRKRQRQTYKG